MIKVKSTGGFCFLSFLISLAILERMVLNGEDFLSRISPEIVVPVDSSREHPVGIAEHSEKPSNHSDPLENLALNPAHNQIIPEPVGHILVEFVSFAIWSQLGRIGRSSRVLAISYVDER